MHMSSYPVLSNLGRAGQTQRSDQFYVHFSDAVFGSDLRVPLPVVQYTEKEYSPRWNSPPVPFCHYQFRDFSQT